jgi:hypothetical protein
MKILGREPALIIGAIGSLLTVLAALNVPGITAGAAAAITALIAAGITAAFTRPVAPAVYTGLVAAGVAVLTEYGLNVPDSVVAALTAAVVACFPLFAIRPQVTPTKSPAASASGAATP